MGGIKCLVESQYISNHDFLEVKYIYQFIILLHQKLSARFQYADNIIIKIFVINFTHMLQDELMAWWSATAKSGGKIPSEEDLRVKVEERKMLGM